MEVMARGKVVRTGLHQRDMYSLVGIDGPCVESVSFFEFGVQHNAEGDEHSSEAAAMLAQVWCCVVDEFQFMLSQVKTSQRVIDPVSRWRPREKYPIPADR